MDTDSLVLVKGQTFIDRIRFVDRNDHLITPLEDTNFEVLQYRFVKTCKVIPDPDNPCRIRQKHVEICCKKIFFVQPLILQLDGSYLASFRIDCRFCNRDTYFIHYMATGPSGELFQAKKFRFKIKLAEKAS